MATEFFSKDGAELSEYFLRDSGKQELGIVGADGVDLGYKYRGGDSWLETGYQTKDSVDICHKLQGRAISVRRGNQWGAPHASRWWLYLNSGYQHGFDILDHMYDVEWEKYFFEMPESDLQEGYQTFSHHDYFFCPIRVRSIFPERTTVTWNLHDGYGQIAAVETRHPDDMTWDFVVQGTSGDHGEWHGGVLDINIEVRGILTRKYQFSWSARTD